MPAGPYAAAPAPAADPTAVVGRRVAGWIVDFLLYLLVMAFFSATPLSPLAEYDENTQDLSQTDACEILADRQDAVQCFMFGDTVYWTDGDDVAVQAVVWLAFVVAYIVLQGLTGWTPGKLIAGIRAVDEYGRVPGIGKSAIRSVLWIIDGLPCLPLVGFICLLTTTGHRRVGDMAAKTFVVRASDLGRPVIVPGMVTAATGPAMGGTYGSPTVYGQAPYPTPAPGPGAWGAPPSPGGPPAGPPTAPQPPAWGQPPAAPGAYGAPPPSPSDTAQYDVPFGMGAPSGPGAPGAPAAPAAPTPGAPTPGTAPDSPADVTVVSPGPTGGDDSAGGPPPSAPPASGDDTAVTEIASRPQFGGAPSGETPAAGEGGPGEGEGGDEPPSRLLAEQPTVPAGDTGDTGGAGGTGVTEEEPVPSGESPTAGTGAEAEGPADEDAAPAEAADADEPADTATTGETEVITVGEPPADADTSAEAPEETQPAEPTPATESTQPTEPAPATESTQPTEPAATTEEAAPAAQQQADSPYQPQWDADRGAYIQWDPNRSRWLQWDDTAKEWNLL
jgi:uncharacterized RDD family membrane protein YckC